MRKQYYLGVVIVMLMMLGMIKASLEVNFQSNLGDWATVSEEIFSTEERVMLSAKEALMLAFDEVEKIMENPLLIKMNSADMSSLVPIKMEGADGKRSVWNISFGNSEGTKLVDCQVKNGKSMVIFESEETNLPLRKGKHSLEDLVIDSVDVMRKAVNDKGIKPGDPDIDDDWIVGYHFEVYDATMANNEKLFVIRVIGISPDSPNELGESLRARIYFDATTGELIKSTKQIGYDEDGRSDWRAF